MDCNGAALSCGLWYRHNSEISFTYLDIWLWLQKRRRIVFPTTTLGMLRLLRTDTPMKLPWRKRRCPTLSSGCRRQIHRHPSWSTVDKMSTLSRLCKNIQKLTRWVRMKRREQIIHGVLEQTSIWNPEGLHTLSSQELEEILWRVGTRFLWADKRSATDHSVMILVLASSDATRSYSERMNWTQVIDRFWVSEVMTSV